MIFFGSRFLLMVIWLLMVTSGAIASDIRSSEHEKKIYLVSHGWHAGLVIMRKDVSGEILRLPPVFNDAKYLEIGWGDLDFYRTPEPHPGLILKAALLPTESVLHVVGFSGSVAAYFPRSEIIEIRLPAFGVERLVTALASGFARVENQELASIGPGLYGESRFFRSTERYHLFNTCNVWTARLLRDAGIPLVPSEAISVDDLMSQARDHGTVINRAPDLPPKFNLDLLEW